MTSLTVICEERVALRLLSFQEMGLNDTVIDAASTLRRSRMWMMPFSARLMDRWQLSIRKPLQKRITRFSGMLNRVDAMMVRSQCFAGVCSTISRAYFLAFLRQTWTVSLSYTSQILLQFYKSPLIFSFITASQNCKHKANTLIRGSPHACSFTPEGSPLFATFGLTAEIPFPIHPNKSLQSSSYLQPQPHRKWRALAEI